MTALPNIAQIYAGIISDLETQFGISINPFGKVVLRAIAGVQSAKIWLIYLALAILQKNIFPDTADSESIGGTLERFGRVKLGRNPFSAVAGQYQVVVTGSIGAIIPVNSTFKSDDDSLNPGVIYILDNAYTLIATTDTIIVRALTSGLAGKLNVGDTLTPTAPIPLVNSGPSSVSVSAESVQPLSAETLEDYRTAILNSYRLEAQGGSAADYRIWSQDAQGVKEVYPYARSGYSSEVNVFVEANTADSTDGKGTPTQQILDDVVDVINFNPNIAYPENGRRPLQVIVNVLPVTIKTIVITITGAQGFTISEQGQILIALTNAMNLTRPFVAAADSLASKNDILDNNKITGIIFTVKPAAVYSGLSFTVNGVSMTSYTFIDGNIPYLTPAIVYN